MNTLTLTEDEMKYLQTQKCAMFGTKNDRYLVIRGKDMKELKQHADTFIVTAPNN